MILSSPLIELQHCKYSTKMAQINGKQLGNIGLGLMGKCGHRQVK